VHEKLNDLHNPRWTLIRITNLPGCVQMSPLTLIEAWRYLSIAPNCPFSLRLDPPYIGSRNSHSCYGKITFFSGMWQAKILVWEEHTASLYLQTLKWPQRFRPQRQDISTRIHGITSQKTARRCTSLCSQSKIKF
jgi:hypothetical protein